MVHFPRCMRMRRNPIRKFSWRHTHTHTNTNEQNNKAKYIKNQKKKITKNSEYAHTSLANPVSAPHSPSPLGK